MNIQVTKLDWKALLNAIDRMDPDAFASFLTEDAVFRFANAEPVKGRANVRENVAGFFSSIKSLNHEALGAWEKDNVITLQGEVTYVRKDDRAVKVPFVNLFKMKGTLIREYLIYVDASQLFA
ncbi:MAG TPA: nuclear transport factor 2 family protein [Methylomirabilota bacterium]|nr:nuclear transport factor 2 family protein [Methylomirabilota bacterium]